MFSFCGFYPDVNNIRIYLIVQTLTTQSIVTERIQGSLQVYCRISVSNIESTEKDFFEQTKF